MLLMRIVRVIDHRMPARRGFNRVMPVRPIKKTGARGPGSRSTMKGAQAVATGILPIFACHSFGPVWCTEVPFESTATVTGISATSNS
jgi:hypothetical protein